MKKNIIETMTKINELRYFGSNLDYLKELAKEYPEMKEVIDFKEKLRMQGYDTFTPKGWSEIPKMYSEQYNKLVRKYFSPIFQEYLEIQATGKNN